MSIFVRTKMYLYHIDIPEQWEYDPIEYVKSLDNVCLHNGYIWAVATKYDGGVAAFPIG